MGVDKKIISVSVRELVEFILKSGDLVSEYLGMGRQLEGIRAHQRIQKTMKDYQSEVTVSKEFELDAFILKIRGRIDGLFERDGKTFIDEIKSTYTQLEKIDENYNRVHWAQAKCYGYIYCLDNNLSSINIQLTYVNLETDKVKRLVIEYSIKQLEEFVYELVNKYGDWITNLMKHQDEKTLSIQQLNFPFDGFRKGQREFALACYNTIKEGNQKQLFVRAPTGIGKTLGTLFPAIKCIGNGYGNKIFYLTAKTIGRDVAEKTLNMLQEHGLRLKRITLTAKSKICFEQTETCNMKECPYTKGYYDKINNVLKEILAQNDSITRDVVESYARKYEICPFELSLDLSNFCDCIICDYNYAFDPLVNLKRFFLEGDAEYIFLVDEAHNLVDRSRSMYSAELYKKPILDIKNKLKKTNIKLSRLYNKLNQHFIDMKKLCDKDSHVYLVKEFDDKIEDLLYSIISMTDKFLLENKEWLYYDELLSVYFDIFSFVKKLDYYSKSYVTYYQIENGDIHVKIFCMDASKHLQSTMKKARASILFSATLLPMKYYKKVLGGKKDCYYMMLPSPFKKEHLGLIINKGISTRYKDREKTINDVVESIYNLTIKYKGNYLIFFPSYAYMEQVYEEFTTKDYSNNYEIVKQNKGMNETEKDEFLKLFDKKHEKNFIAFAIMGGSFSEGIDLVGEKLCGVVVVGVGLPLICFERNLIKDFFDKSIDKGFSYAYVFPGMNKVMQSVGRVIRSEKDKGTALLIDDRFAYSYYKQLFPIEWNNAHWVNKSVNIGKLSNEFWLNDGKSVF